MTSPKETPKENPLYNFLLNVLLPVLALSVLSKDGNKPWHIGPVWGMSLAVIIPLAYGIWFYLRTRKANVFSFIGLGSVLLTGGITLFVWRSDGTVHPQAALAFSIKEASIPLILGICVIASHFTATPLVRVFLFNPDLFDIPRIEKSLTEQNRQEDFKSLLWHTALAFGGSFIFSTVLNFFLAMHFLGGVDTAALNARELYNAAVARQTFWGFVVIGVPIFIMLFALLWWAVRRLEAITGLERDDLLLGGR